jgi:hypothetical protein
VRRKTHRRQLAAGADARAVGENHGSGWVLVTPTSVLQAKWPNN